MRTWHPDSWSKQARELGDRAIDNVNCGAWCIEQARRFFALSYRPELIRMRAAKRFWRYVKMGKIHETPESVVAWEAYKAKRYLKELEAIVGEYLDY